MSQLHNCPKIDESNKPTTNHVPTAVAMPDSCTICHAKESKLCSRCRSISYCSETCQKIDFKQHEILCQGFDEFTSQIRPSTSVQLAVVYPVDEIKPKLIWVEVQEEFIDSIICGDGGAVERKFLIGEDGLPYFEAIVGGWPEDTGAGRLLHLVSHPDSLLVGKCEKNLSLSKTLKGDMDLIRAGLLLIVAACRDISIADYNIALKYLRTFGKVKGVKLSCHGDKFFLGAKKYIEVEVPGSHAIFNGKRQPPDISVHMSLPLLIEKLRVYRSWKSRFREAPVTPTINRAAVYLNMKANPREPGFGFADPRIWNTEVVSCLLVRQDKKTLTIHQAEALVIYHRFELSPNHFFTSRSDAYEQGWSEEQLIRKREQIVRVHMTKKKFDEFFFERLKGEKVVEDAAWADAVSPYMT